MNRPEGTTSDTSDWITAPASIECPECFGDGDYDVFAGSSAWGYHGAHPIYKTVTCERCNGFGTVDAEDADGD